MPLFKRSTLGPLILFMVILFSSCQHPRQNYIRGILANVCFWDILEQDLNAKNVTYTYRLLPDGTCYKYRYHYSKDVKQNAVSHMDMQKGEVDVRWHLQSDSVVTIEDRDYKIRRVEQDAIWLETLQAQSVVLQKNCSTFIRE